MALLRAKEKMKINGIKVTINLDTLWGIFKLFGKPKPVEVNDILKIHKITYRVYDVDDDGFKVVKEP